ncbi:retrovirus-related pol polyprotein from transposon TNT 1-94 [Tanacetum coccineum]
MNHPVDGKAWNFFDIIHSEFAKDPKNVRLGLAADGFNPFGNLSQTYNMWPVIMTTYNTPSWMCMKETSFMLTMLIPDPKSPAKDIDVFLQPLIKELQTLWSGVWTRDVVTGTDFKMKAALLWTINDFSTRSSLSGWSGQGYLACPTCNKDTPSAKVRRKIVYVGHRKFLCLRHTMRMKRTFNGKIDMTPIPKTLTNADIMNQLRVLPRCVPRKHSSNKQKPCDRNVKFNWNKRSIFYDLEYWPTLQLKHNLDVMHIEKNVHESLLVKPEGSIAEGYVAEEALTFCSHYLKGVETRFNRPDRNGFGLNPTDTFQVVEDVHHRKIWYRDVVEDEQDVIHDNNSSDVVLFAELGNLEYTILSTNDESTEVDAPPDNKVANKEGADFIGDEDDVVPHMACVAPRSHGGDAGGDPPDDRRPRMLPYQCEGSGKRGESKHKALKKAFKQNGYRKLEIVFEAKDQKTFKPVGRYGANFSSYVGELIKEIPQYYDSWEKVPPADKAPLIPRLQTYFDLQPHLNDETVIKINGEDKTVGSLVRAGLQRDFARRYSDNKCKFKDKWFNKKTVEQARQEKPPKWKAGDAQWQKLVDFWSDPDRMKQSERNAANRAKNKFEENQRYEGLIDHWRRRHSDKDGNFRTRENETLYVSKVFPNKRNPLVSRPIDGELSYQTRLDASTVVFVATQPECKTTYTLVYRNKVEMKAIQDAITAGTIPPKTDREILVEVTRSINRAHIAGVGRNLAGTGNLDYGRAQPYPGAIRRPEEATCFGKRGAKKSI